MRGARNEVAPGAAGFEPQMSRQLTSSPDVGRFVSTDRAAQYRDDVRTILDTSAIRGLAVPMLRALSRIMTLEHPPYAFREVYSHLDENYARVRGEVLKFASLSCLPSAYLQLARTAGVEELASPLHRLTAPNIAGVLELLADASTLQEFEAAWERAKKDGRRIDTPGGTRKLLERDEHEFSEMLDGLLDAVKRILVQRPSWRPEMRDVVQLCMSGTKTLAEIVRSRGHADASLEEELSRATFLWYAYGLFRAFDYVTSQRSRDVNDAEDAFGVLHLDVGVETTFVCNDNFTVSVVTQTVNALNELLAARASPARALVSVMTREALRQKYLPRAVEQAAYELWESRGRRDGCAVDDWLEARRILRLREDEHA